MEWHSLSPRARVLFHLQAVVSLLTVHMPIASVLAFGLSTQVPLLWAVISGLCYFFLFAQAAIWYPSLSFDRWAWLEREEDVLIAHGVLVREVVAIPRQRIQHVDVRQGPLEQWFGLARLEIYTASGMGSDGTIPGLQKDIAERLRDHLIKGTGDDGV